MMVGISGGREDKAFRIHLINPINLDMAGQGFQGGGNRESGIEMRVVGVLGDDAKKEGVEAFFVPFHAFLPCQGAKLQAWP